MSNCASNLAASVTLSTTKFASEARDLLKQAEWPSFPDLSMYGAASEVPHEPTISDNAKPAIVKAPACWGRVEEHEEREREKEAAAQFLFAPAPNSFSDRLVVKPAPTSQRPPLPSFLQDQHLQKLANDRSKRPPPAHTALNDPNPIEDHVARKRFVDEKLAAILGPERMKFKLSRSGHSGIDPVIAEHNLKAATQDLLNKFRAHQAEERKFAEELQRQANDEEIVRYHNAVLLDHYRAQYVGHVASLIAFGPLLNNALDQLDTAVDTKVNHRDIPRIVSAMLDELFSPVYTIMQKMRERIPLEEEGSKALKVAWPLDRLDSLLKWLHSLPNLIQIF